jgi:hypothetical protein
MWSTVWHDNKGRFHETQSENQDIDLNHECLSFIKRIFHLLKTGHWLYN